MAANRVIIDADACPRQALVIAQLLCLEKGWTCVTYASYNHQFSGPHHVSVDAGPQAVDLRIINDVAAGDIVVTQDIGLAAMVLGKQAASLTPGGHTFDRERIAFQLEYRHEAARYRRGGGRTKGPAARTAEDDRRFHAALSQLMDKQEG